MLDAKRRGRFFQMNGPWLKLTLRGLWLGHGSVRGGAGGAILAAGGASVELTSCTLEGNWAVEGGALAVQSPVDGELSGGQSGKGGDVPEVTLTGVTFLRNEAAGRGGALVAAGNLLGRRCSFVGNSAAEGGAVALDSNAAWAGFEQVEFIDNSAQTGGEQGFSKHRVHGSVYGFGLTNPMSAWMLCLLCREHQHPGPRVHHSSIQACLAGHITWHVTWPRIYTVSTACAEGFSPHRRGDGGPDADPQRDKARAALL
jgi:hypothetical protein